MRSSDALNTGVHSKWRKMLLMRLVSVPLLASIGNLINPCLKTSAEIRGQYRTLKLSMISSSIGFCGIWYHPQMVLQKAENEVQVFAFHLLASLELALVLPVGMLQTCTVLLGLSLLQPILGSLVTIMSFFAWTVLQTERLCSSFVVL